MKNRECPCCHKQVSLRRCSSYFWKGVTPITMRCNHCHEEIRIVKNPVPLAFWVIGGVVMGNLPSILTYFCFRHDFLKAILYSLPTWPIIISTLVVVSLMRMKFEKEDSVKELEAFRKIREMAESGQLPDLTLDEINEEIRLAREKMG